MPVNVPCKSCGALNHFNRVRCATCGSICKGKKRGRPRGKVQGNGGSGDVKLSCLGQVKGDRVVPERSTPPLGGSTTVKCDKGKKRKGDDPPRPLTSSRVIKPCPSCGELNSLLYTHCSHCQQSLAPKRGRPTKTSDDYGTKPCPSCGELNSLLYTHCSHCQQSLAPKRGRPTKTSDDYSTKPCPSSGELNSLLNTHCSHYQRSLAPKRGRPTKTSDDYSTEPCPSCGELNSLLNTHCSHCQQSLAPKRGRPTKTSDDYSTKPCPSCGELNSLLNRHCSHCQRSLAPKRGRPTKTSGDYSTEPCPSCGALNSLLYTHCSHCQQALIKRGRISQMGTKPCPSCGELNSLLNTHCSHCQQSLASKRGELTETSHDCSTKRMGRPRIHERPCPSCGVMNNNNSYICVECNEPLNEIAFDSCIELPMEWNVAVDSVNLSDDLLAKLRLRCAQQREFDTQPLIDRVCYNCGKLLLNTTNTTHCQISPPNGMDTDNAPASAYLRTISNCGVHFVVSNNSDIEKWFCCNYCKNHAVPVDQHVGDVYTDDHDVKPVSEWCMSKPKPIAALSNNYERQQISLCRLFSKTVKDAGVSQFKHVQGEVNSGRKLDRHYYGLFGFLACRSEDIWEHSPNPNSSIRIHHAVNWLHKNNPLYATFFSEYETLLRYVKPSFINPALLESQNLSLKHLLEEEAIGMAFPIDSRYFDQFPLIYNTNIDSNDDIAGKQFPRPECQAKLHEMVYTKYGEKHLDVKTFPHLHPWGFGGWHYNCEMSFSAHIRMRLYDVRGWFASDFLYPFFKFDFMTKSRLRAYASKRYVQVSNLAEPLNASKVKVNDPYVRYGTEVPRTIPGSAQYWRAFGLDLIAMVEQRGLPDFFLTLSAHDGWPQVQATLRDGWGAVASENDVQDLAAKVSDRQSVGWHPEMSVLAAEKRFKWFMNLLKSDDGPLGQVEELVIKKEYQKRGAVHWHMLVWVKPGTAPPHAVMAEVPRGSDTSDKVAAYVRKLVETMMLHKVCNPNRCLKGNYGKPLTKCKYGFPFSIPEPCRRLDADHIRYLDMRRLSEDAFTVQYNPEIAVLWGAHHNVQHVSKHGFEQYLAKYISKSEPSSKIELLEDCSEPQKYLRTRVIGAIEALEILMGFEQHQASRIVVYLPTELKPSRKTLKPKRELENLSDDSESVYCETRLEKYLQRPSELSPLTYPDFFRWWDLASSSQQQKAADAAAEGGTYCVTRQGSDDFAAYIGVSKSLRNAQNSLSQLLHGSTYSPETREDIIALVRCMRYHEVPKVVVDAVVKHYEGEGIDVGNTDVHMPLSEDHCVRLEHVLSVIDFCDQELVTGLSSYHWLINIKPSESLISILTRYPPGSMLRDKNDRYWVRRSKMVMTRHRFLSCIGDDQENYYEQKFLLSVPITDQSEIVQNPPSSWIEHCVRLNMCDTHLDAIACMQSGISHGFSVEALRSLAQLYVEHRFLTHDEADTFLSDIPVPWERDEPQSTVADYMLDDAHGQFDGLTTNTPTNDLSSIVSTFTDSQARAYKWVENQLAAGKQIRAAIVGPAGTGKSYLLRGLIELLKSKQLVVMKLAPSGVAAHLIGGTTLHNFFGLDIECHSSLENGTVQVTKLRKTDVLIIDEFSMLNFFLFRTAEGLCRKFAKKNSSCHPWGGRHVILLGDPAQLPAIGHRDIFGTQLWRTFSVLILREVKRATDPILSSVLLKVRMGICDKEVTQVLKSRLQPRNINDIQLDRTVVICSTRAECDEINEECLQRVDGNPVSYEAIDTDHNGHPLREADVRRLQHCREKLPDCLTVKIGARVILRRNINISSGWVNGTLAVVVSMHSNCIVVQKLTNSAHRYPVPRFKQKIEIQGASYSIMRQQFPLQLAYGVTVHRIQGCTIQKAIVCLNNKFFESGQAYVALSRVRKLEDLVLWDFCTTAINLLQFYKQLLAWCNSVDQINTNPSTEEVAYPERCDDISNKPLLDSTTSTDEDSTQSIAFSEEPKKPSPVKPPQKQSGTTKGPSNKPLPPPDPKPPKLNQTTNTQQVNKTSSQPTPLRVSNSHNNAIVLLNSVCSSMLNDLSSQSTHLESVVAYFEPRTAILDQVVQYLNSLPVPYADTLPNLHVDRHVLHESHPIFLQTFKPIATTGDGNCMYHGLSLALCGTENLSVVIRLLTAYALIKHRTVMMEILADIYFSGNHQQHVQMFTNTLHKAIHLGIWGTDLHLLPLSLLLNRPIFTYTSFYSTLDSVRVLNLSDTRDPHHLAQRFSSRDRGTTGHFLFCSDVLRVSLYSGDIASLPYPPLSLFNVLNQHWVALLMLSPSVAAHVPIPTTRLL